MGHCCEKPRAQASRPFTFLLELGVGRGQREGSGSSSALHPPVPAAPLFCPLFSLHFPTFHLALRPSLSLSPVSLILSPALFLFIVCSVPTLDLCLLSRLLPWPFPLSPPRPRLPPSRPCTCLRLEGGSVVRRPREPQIHPQTTLAYLG